MEVAWHHQVPRTFMAPPPHNSDSSLSTYNQNTPRSSDSTTNTAHSTLFSTPPVSTPTPPIYNQSANPGAVKATNNVINRVADANASLFQICLTLKQRLQAIDELNDEMMDIEEHLQQEEDDEKATDPVHFLWTLLKRGTPLIILFNAARPHQQIPVAGLKKVNKQKDATFKFLSACIKVFGFSPEQMFTITDLFGKPDITQDNVVDLDSSGFVKVTRVISRIIDIMVEEGNIDFNKVEGQGSSFAPKTKLTHRHHIVDEMVRTERTYVQHLELLHAFKRYIEERGTIPGDAIHDIFLNLNQLLNFQRRFLIRVEQVNAQPEAEQNWGALFLKNAEQFKSSYGPFIENQKNCEAVAMREYARLREGGGSVELRQMVESPTHFTAFLLKPFQRLAKYPLLLKELAKRGDYEDPKKVQDLVEGREAIEEILATANASLAAAERAEVVNQLKEQVDDWKGHRVEAFGSLLLSGTYTVMKGEQAKNDRTREYHMYLFEKILLCCKEVDVAKKAGRNLMRQQSSTPQPGGIKPRPKLQLKGRIFMQNVTDSITTSSPGDYQCQIHWRGDDSTESFQIRFPTEEILIMWREAIDRQRALCQEQQRQGQLDNPYRDEDDVEDDEGVDSAVSSYSDLETITRNASSTSLRSRSTTGESAQPAFAVGQRFPGRLPGGLPALRTQQLQDLAPSPGEHPGASYFSPSVESPISTRTSSSSAQMFPFPRQPVTGQNNGWYAEDQSSRFTAPAGRTLIRDPQTGSYSLDTRGGRPPASGAYPMHHAALAQNRSRSASSPDIHNVMMQARRTPVNAPPVPSIPAQLQANQATVNRSQNNSPIYSVASRSTGNSPNAKRPSVQHTQHQTYSGAGAIVNPRVGSLSAASGVSAPSINGDSSQPSQIRVKVHVPTKGSTMTLVVGFNINYQSLRDRIDAKLSRVGEISLASGAVKLTYACDGDMVSIQNDEDVQSAFETWREENPEPAGQMGEIELVCL